jgi:hypothetical protein
MAYKYVYADVCTIVNEQEATNRQWSVVPLSAVNAYYTDYGKYPVVVDDTPIADNSDLFYTLRAINMGTANLNDAANPRKIVFISPRVLGTTSARSGIGSDGQYYDPWRTPYRIAIDGSYDNQLTNPYTDAPGGTTLYRGVIVWSFGKNGALGGGPAAPGFSATEPGTAGNFSAFGDVISWQ